MVAIKYQIAIMIAIFTGTTITVILGIILTAKKSFSKYGVLESLYPLHQLNSVVIFYELLMIIHEPRLLQMRGIGP